MTPSDPDQFALPVGLPGGPAMDNYWPGPNREALEALERTLAGRGERFLYLWGPAGSGKSHLLLAACRRLSAEGSAPVYVPLYDAARFAPDMLRGLERLDLVCVDGIDRVSGQPAWESELFHLFNRAAESRTPLLVASRHAPASPELSLEDLASRLSSGLAFRLKRLDDEGRRHALQLRALRRGFRIPDEAAEYLLRREARDMHSLFALLDRLDRATLRSKRRVTVPFVKRLLERGE